MKPKSPESPSFSELAARSVKILWIPGEDGGIEQTIHVQYKSGTETEWITENILASRGQTHLVVDSLSPGTLYQFRLYASNEIGNSRNTHSTYFATPCEGRTSITIFMFKYKHVYKGICNACIYLNDMYTVYSKPRSFELG